MNRLASIPTLRTYAFFNNTVTQDYLEGEQYHRFIDDADSIDGPVADSTHDQTVKIDEIKNWANKINRESERSVESILNVGRLLINAKKALHHGIFKKMVEENLPFKPRPARDP